jgi:hypothetical protein
VSRGFFYQEGEYYEETLTLVIEEIFPVFVKKTRTMISIQYEFQGGAVPVFEIELPP